MNFVFLISALRVWCQSMAEETADSAVYNVNEGGYTTFLNVKISSISHMAHFHEA